MRTVLLLLMLGVAGAAQADSFIGGQVTLSTEVAACQGDVPSVKPAECPQGYILSVPTVGTAAAKPDEVIRIVPPVRLYGPLRPVAPKPGTVKVQGSTINSTGTVNTGVEVR